MLSFYGHLNARQANLLWQLDRPGWGLKKAREDAVFSALTHGGQVFGVVICEWIPNFSLLP
jgi:hypothetical protein